MAKIWGGTNFRSLSPLTLAVSEVNTPYSSSEPHKSVVVNSQIGVGNSKYVVVFDPLPTGHVIGGMLSELFGF